MPFDANKLYCSEILAILLQNNDSKCVSVNGFWLPNDANLSLLSFTSPLSRTGRKCTVSFFLFSPTFTLFTLFCYYLSFLWLFIFIFYPSYICSLSAFLSSFHFVSFPSLSVTISITVSYLSNFLHHFAPLLFDFMLLSMFPFVYFPSLHPSFSHSPYKSIYSSSLLVYLLSPSPH